MKAEYDLSKLKSRKNPYASKLKKPVTMRLSEDVVEYFKGMAEEAGIPYQSLINLYLDARVSASIAHNNYRKRDERFDGQDHYKDKGSALHDKSEKPAAPDKPRLFGADDFHWNQDTNICIFPAGKRMSGKPSQIKDYMVVKFKGAERGCMSMRMALPCAANPRSTASSSCMPWCTVFMRIEIASSGRLIRSIRAIVALHSDMAGLRASPRPC
jgi:hypothetical protein